MKASRADLAVVATIAASSGDGVRNEVGRRAACILPSAPTSCLRLWVRNVGAPTPARNCPPWGTSAHPRLPCILVQSAPGAPRLRTATDLSDEEHIPLDLALRFESEAASQPQRPDVLGMDRGALRSCAPSRSQGAGAAARRHATRTPSLARPERGSSRRSPRRASASRARRRSRPTPPARLRPRRRQPGSGSPLRARAT